MSIAGSPTVGRRLLIAPAVGAVARVAYWIAVRDQAPRSDAAQYVEIARNVAAGHGFSMEYPWFARHPTAFRPPLYPLLISPPMIGGSAAVWPAKLLTMLLGLAAIVVAQRYVELVAGRRAALIAALGVALYPPLIANDVAVLAESLSVCLLGGMLLALHARRPIAVGLLLGALLLAKPGAPLPAVTVLALVAWGARGAGGTPASWRDRARPAAMAAGTALLVVTPWLIRNHQVMGVDSITTSTGFTLAAIYSPEAQEAGRFVDPSIDPAFDGSDLKLAQSDEGAWSRALQDRAVDGLRSDPGYVAEVAVRNLLSWVELDPERNRTAEQLDGRHLGIRRWTLPLVWVVMVIGSAGMVRLWVRDRSLTLPLLALAYTVPSLLTVAPPRLRAPFDYLMVMAAALVVEAWWSRRAARRSVGAPDQSASAAGSLSASVPE